jgi:hypothetical protein
MMIFQGDQHLRPSRGSAQLGQELMKQSKFRPLLLQPVQERAGRLDPGAREC